MDDLAAADEAWSWAGARGVQGHRRGFTARGDDFQLHVQSEASGLSCKENATSRTSRISKELLIQGRSGCLCPRDSSINAGGAQGQANHTRSSVVRARRPPRFICLLFGTFCVLCGSDTVGVRVICITRPLRPQPCGRGAIRASLNQALSSLNGLLYHASQLQCCRTCSALAFGMFQRVGDVSSNDQVTHTASLTSIRILPSIPSPNMDRHSQRHAAQSARPCSTFWAPFTTT